MILRIGISPIFAEVNLFVPAAVINRSLEVCLGKFF